jgi:hypothetical protein
MTEHEEVIIAFDDFLKKMGCNISINSVIDKFGGIPEDKRNTVLSSIKEDVAKAIKESAQKITSEMGNAANNPDLIAELSKLSPKDIGENVAL